MKDPLVTGEGSRVTNSELYEVTLEDGGAAGAHGCSSTSSSPGAVRVNRGGASGAGTPTTQSKIMSSMEEECIRERIHNTLLRECSNILAADNTLRYTKEAFRRVFQEKVSDFFRKVDGVTLKESCCIPV